MKVDGGQRKNSDLKGIGALLPPRRAGLNRAWSSLSSRKKRIG